MQNNQTKWPPGINKPSICWFINVGLYFEDNIDNTVQRQFVKHIQENGSKCNQIQTNTSKYKEMQENVSKYKQIQATKNKCKQIQANTRIRQQT